MSQGMSYATGFSSQTLDIARVWNRDTTLWTDADEDKWLGWLDIADRELAQRQRFEEIAAHVQAKGFRVVAHDFVIGGWTPVKTVTIPDDGEGRSHMLYLYVR